MSAAQLVALLAAAGTPPELLAAVAEQLFAGQTAQAAIDARRANDRDRKTRKAREVTGTHVNGRDGRGKPPQSSPKENNQTPSLPPVEASEARASSPQPRPWALPAGVSLQVWTDFKKNRVKKRLPNTDTSWKTFCDDLARVALQTGIPPPELIEICTGKGWGSINDPKEQRHGHSTSNVTSLRGSRPDPALDLLRAARAAEDREDSWGAGTALPAIGSGGP